MGSGSVLTHLEHDLTSGRNVLAAAAPVAFLLATDRLQPLPDVAVVPSIAHLDATAVREIGQSTRPTLVRIFASGDLGECADLVAVAGVVSSPAAGRAWLQEHFDVMYVIALRRHELTARRVELHAA